MIVKVWQWVLAARIPNVGSTDGIIGMCSEDLFAPASTNPNSEFITGIDS